jgi:hypothetical protein
VTALDISSHTSDRPATSSLEIVAANRRHGIARRLAEGDGTLAECVHALLGANASHTIEGGLAQAQVFAELLAVHLETERHVGTLARHLVVQIEVLTALVEDLDLDARAGEEVKTK